mgnify:CR=1 FL=1
MSVCVLTLLRIGNPKGEIVSEKIFQNPSFADVIGCCLYDQKEFSNDILEKQGNKQKKPGFKGFFNWLDQYI